MCPFLYIISEYRDFSDPLLVGCRSLDDRFDAADQLRRLEGPAGLFVVDTMADRTSIEYAAYPGPGGREKKPG